MPTVRGIPGQYRFFFYSFDCNEPRFWLEPVALGTNNGFPAKELNRIRKIVIDNLDRIVEAWDEHCGG
jgi:hypothetical protein